MTKATALQLRAGHTIVCPTRGTIERVTWVRRQSRGRVFFRTDAHDHVRPTDFEIELVGSKFTASDALARLRSIAREARIACLLPNNCRVEVGQRLFPFAIVDQYIDESTDLYSHGPGGEGDDLADFQDLYTASRDDDVRSHGAIVHLYLSTTGPYGELSDVVIGWMGTPDDAPRLLNTNGRYRG